MLSIVIKQTGSGDTYKAQRGYTIQVNNGPVQNVAKGSPLAQCIRLLIRLGDLGQQVEGYS